MKKRIVDQYHKSIQSFQKIPGIGPSIAKCLWDLGYRDSGQIKNANPQIMYENLCTKRKTKIDRCVLYVFRCAVYYTSHTRHDPELLKWWNWKE